MSDRARKIKRSVDLATEDLRETVLGMVEWGRVTGVTNGAGSVPTATTDEGEKARVYEPYGFASAPPGNATALMLAPGGEYDVRCALPASSPGARPATAAGDTAVYTAAGHQVVLDDDGPLTITSKDDAVIELDNSGNIDVDPAAGAKVRLGGDAASLGVARKTDKTVADTTMAIWLPSAQSILSAAAALLGLPLPVAPTDFGVINTASDEVVSK